MALRRRVLSPVRGLSRLVFYRGVLGSNRTWIGVFAVFLGARAFRKIFLKTEEVAAVERLAPGQGLTIIAIDRLAERRAAKQR